MGQFLYSCINDNKSYFDYCFISNFADEYELQPRHILDKLSKRKLKHEH